MHNQITCISLLALVCNLPLVPEISGSKNIGHVFTENNVGVGGTVQQKQKPALHCLPCICCAKLILSRSTRLLVESKSFT